MYREKIISIAELYKDDPDVIELVNDTMDACGVYVELVNRHESAVIIARYRMEPREYREHVADLDNRRHTAHENLISQIKMLNRICAGKGLEPFYPGDTGDRYSIADYAKGIVDEIFRDRQR